MKRPMKLLCTISANDDSSPGMYLVRTNHFDGTQVTIRTSQYNVELSQPITKETPTVFGSLMVVQEAKQGELVSITMPSPSLEYGVHINVKESQLTPLGVTINNFK
jgi:hypothetical protein